MAQRQRQCELPVWKSLHEPLCAAVVKLDGATANSRTSTKAQAQTADQQAKKRIRRRPKYAYEKDDAIDRTTYVLYVPKTILYTRFFSSIMLGW